jgi:hypothetical protein
LGLLGGVALGGITEFCLHFVSGSLDVVVFCIGIKTECFDERCDVALLLLRCLESCPERRDSTLKDTVEGFDTPYLAVPGDFQTNFVHPCIELCLGVGSLASFATLLGRTVGAILHAKENATDVEDTVGTGLHMDVIARIMRALVRLEMPARNLARMCELALITAITVAITSKVTAESADLDRSHGCWV